MHKRWISTLLVCIVLLSMCIHPSAARLSEGLISLSSLTANGSGEKLITYQIQKGDNLWDISRRNHVSLETIMAINHLSKNSILSVGERLKIPSGKGLIHVVKSGETLSSIAARYKITVARIQNANKLRNPDCLNIGDRLTIPSQNAQQLAQSSLQPSRGLSWGGLLSWPITGTITSSFGYRRSGFHHGLDIANEIGSPIKAAAAGKVIFTGWKSVYGRTVILEHPDGKKTLYAHTQKILVQNMQTVKSGQTIATVGVSGNTTGPHLHFEVRIGDKTYDPLRYLGH